MFLLGFAAVLRSARPFGTFYLALTALLTDPSVIGLA
jgi:hypothetical protein